MSKPTGYLAYNKPGETSGISMCAFEKLTIERGRILLTPYAPWKVVDEHLSQHVFICSEMQDIKIVEIDDCRSARTETTKALWASRRT